MSRTEPRVVIPDSARVVACLREAAEREILPRFRQLADDEVMEKNPGDLVTVADVASEQCLAGLLTDLLPGSVVVGEEGCARDPSQLDRLREAAPVWVIDPIDGTYNFVHGLPDFAVMVALAVAGEAIAGWIHFPVTDVTASVVRGEGAYVGATRLHTAAAAPLGSLVGSVSIGALPRVQRGRLAQRRHELGDIRDLRCAASEYVELASGRWHFVLYRRLHPWDHAVGVLMVREAGGYDARLADGQRYRLIDPGTGLLSAANQATWTTVQDYLRAV